VLINSVEWTIQKKIEPMHKVSRPII